MIQPRWTDREHRRLIELARAGELFSTIAEMMDRPTEGVRSKYLDLLDAMTLSARQDTRVERDSNLKLPGRSLASDAQLADRDARALARTMHRSLTAILCGDPLPGWSAFDRKPTEGRNAS